MYERQHTSLQQRRREQRFGALSNQKDEDLLLFREMQKRERDTTHESVAQPLHTGSRASIVPPKSTEDDIFASSEWDKHDYYWLMTPPPTHFLPAVKHEPVGNGFSLSGSAVARSSLKATSRIESMRSEPLSSMEPSSSKSFDLQQAADPSASLTTSTSSISQKSHSSSSGRPIRAPTPARSTTPVSRPVARPSTPSKSATSSASIHSSTSTGRVANPSNRLANSSRQSTPIKRPATPTRVNNPSNTSVKSVTVNKATALPSKSASLSRPSSPATRVRRQPAAHPVVFLETPQEPPSNLRTSVVDRTLSDPRGSMALKANTTAAAKAPQPQPADTGARNRRLSSSPLMTRGHVSSDSLNGDKSSIRNGKPHDGVVVSSKMVDRIMPPRKPMPLSQEKAPVGVNSQGKIPALRDTKSTSQARESSGFGRNLSKKSLDMALRHMDIRGSTQSGFQSFMSNIPTSSLYSVRSGKSRSVSTGRGNSTSSIASSPMATSSNASFASEHGMSIVIDPESSELGDETWSEMGSRASPTSQPDPSMAFCNKRKVTYWLRSPGYMDDTCGDIMEIFEQGLANLSSPESPLISQQGEIIDCDDFVLEPI